MQLKRRVESGSRCSTYESAEEKRSIPIFDRESRNINLAPLLGMWTPKFLTASLKLSKSNLEHKTNLSIEFRKTNVSQINLLLRYNLQPRNHHINKHLETKKDILELDTSFEESGYSSKSD